MLLLDVLFKTGSQFLCSITSLRSLLVMTCLAVSHSRHSCQPNRLLLLVVMLLMLPVGVSA